jgi:transposase
MAVAILSGPERRRRWTQAEKLRLVEETLAAEANIAEIARRHDVHPNLLHAWRRQARTRLLVGAVEEKPRPDERVRFAAVAIAPERPALPAAVAPSAAGVIDVEFAAGGRMRITGAVEASLVSALIKALAKSKGRR